METNETKEGENLGETIKGKKKQKAKTWQPVIIALITTIGGVVAGYVTAKTSSEKAGVQTENSQVVVPSSIIKEVETLPEELNSDLYELKKDVSIFDLRQWKPTPDSLIDTRFSPANYTNYLHIKKTKPLSKIVIHYSTSGYAIDMRCITNRFDFYKKKKAEFDKGAQSKEYALVIDVSDIPINQEFLIVVEATYWNGFKNLLQEDASTYTDDEIHGLDELGLIVFFPEEKPFTKCTKYDTETKSNKSLEYRGLENYYEDRNNKFIYWSIKNRVPGHHYTLTWKW